MADDSRISCACGYTPPTHTHAEDCPIAADRNTVTPVPNAEADFRSAMFQAEAENRYEDAALAALGLAEMVALAGCPEGALYCAQRAQVYATLHHAQNVVWVAENRRERMP